MALLRLPADMLTKIASHTVAPDLVVAAGKNVEARTALRKGTDEAERSRFGGIGMTVREAEHVLRTQYRNILWDSDLTSRAHAGLALTTKCEVNIVGDEVEDGGEPRIHQGLVTALLAYGAEPSVPEDSHFGHTLLHTANKADDPVALARLLLAAGANIDARCTPPNGAGFSPLAWCIRCGGYHSSPSESTYALAIFLIEQGCDVVQAAADYASQHSNGAYLGTLIEILDSYDRTVENRHLVDLITAALEAAGPEGCRAAADAARQYATEHHRGEDGYRPLVLAPQPSDEDDY
jgi:hypothetical protein